MQVTSLHVAVVIALGMAASTSMAGELAIGKADPGSISESVSISGPYDVGVSIGDGKQLDFSGKELSIDITQGAGWGSGNRGVQSLLAEASSAQQSTVNLGKKGVTEAVTVKVTDNSGLDDITLGLYASGYTPKNGEPNKKGGVINVNAKSVVVDVNSKTWAYGLYSQNKSTTADSDFSTININADDIYINASTTGAREDGYEANAMVVQSQGVMNINGNLEAHATTNVISARGHGVLRINEDGLHSTKLYGNIDFNYDKKTSGTVADATVIINLSGKDSIWVGNSSTSYGSGRPAAESYLGVTGLQVALQNGAVWEPTIVNEADYDQTDHVAYTPLNLLALNDGTINIKNAGQTVKVQNLKGSGGTINVAAEAENGAITSVGKLSIGQVAEDSAVNLAVNATGINADDVSDAGAAMAAVQDAVQVSSGKAESVTSAIAEGAVKGAIQQTVNADGTVSAVRQEENTKLASLGSLGVVGLLAWRHETNDLTKRMGELRDSPEGIGGWVRLYGSEQEYARRGLTSKSTSVQAGSDFSVGGGWKAGGAFSYTDGSASLANGSADNDAWSLAGYGTWMAENGLFVDLIAKYGRLTNDFTIASMKGKAKNNAYSASVEAGWHLPVSQYGFIEPQAELTYGAVQGDDFTTSSGVLVSQDDAKSLVGRLGVRTGLHFPEKKGTVYARASILHDFKGDSQFTASLASNSAVRSTVQDDIGGTYYEMGLGASFNWTKSASTYLDLERQGGGEVKENWRWNAGFRYVW